MSEYTISAVAEVNSIWLYLLYIMIAAFIITQSVVYLVKSIRRAKKINMDMAKIKKVITTSILFTILPSIGIFIGVITLAGSLGMPLPSIRLSVIGSLQYETLAADTVAQYVGEYSGLKAMLEATGGAISGDVFVTFCFAMTFGIIWGPLYCLIFFKKFQPKMLSVTKKNNSWSKIIFAAVFIGMVLAYLAVAISELFYLIPGVKLSSALTSSVAQDPRNLYSVTYGLVAVVVAAFFMWIFEQLITKKKQKWLENFSLAFSMLLGMGAVAGVNAIVLAVA